MVRHAYITKDIFERAIPPGGSGPNDQMYALKYIYRVDEEKYYYYTAINKLV